MTNKDLDFLSNLLDLGHPAISAIHSYEVFKKIIENHEQGTDLATEFAVRMAEIDVAVTDNLFKDPAALRKFLNYRLAKEYGHDYRTEKNLSSLTIYIALLFCASSNIENIDESLLEICDIISEINKLDITSSNCDKGARFKSLSRFLEALVEHRIHPNNVVFSSIIKRKQKIFDTVKYCSCLILDGISDLWNPYYDHDFNTATEFYNNFLISMELDVYENNICHKNLGRFEMPGSPSQIISDRFKSIDDSIKNDFSNQIFSSFVEISSNQEQRVKRRKSIYSFRCKGALRDGSYARIGPVAYSHLLIGCKQLKQGDLIDLGHLYFDGIYVQRNKEKSFEYFSESINKKIFRNYLSNHRGEYIHKLITMAEDKEQADIFLNLYITHAFQSNDKKDNFFLILALYVAVLKCIENQMLDAAKETLDLALGISTDIEIDENYEKIAHFYKISLAKLMEIVPRIQKIGLPRANLAEIINSNSLDIYGTRIFCELFIALHGDFDKEVNSFVFNYESYFPAFEFLGIGYQ